MAMQTWEIISYDVWGNEEDGFEVNAAYRTGRLVEFDSQISNKQLEDMAFDWAGCMVETDPHYCDNERIGFFVAGTGEPAFEIQRIGD